jgi:hypothetical protein
MVTRRFAILLLAGALGCARGTEQKGGPNPMPDAANSNVDAAGGTDSQPPIDSAQPTIDAPAGSCAMPFSGVLATWSFAGQTGSETQVASSSTAPGVTAGAVKRAAAINATTGSGSINSNGWASTAQVDPTKYYTFTITPPSGCALDLTSLAIDAKSSATGPAMAAVGTSSDSYAQTSTVGTAAASTPSLSVSGATGMIEVRVFGFSASSSSGTMRVQNTLTISGALN